MLTDKTLALAQVCHALSTGASDEARERLRSSYPFDPQPIIPRRYGPWESTRVFMRDGFVDRYSGDLLVFPPVLRVISQLLPEDFPFHPNWKTDVTHSAYWQIGATVDHLVPVTIGGADDESNWVTTSMAHNSAKMNWSLVELGWKLHPPGRFEDWDGLMHWFVDIASARRELLTNGSVRQWYRAAQRALAK